jgi:hypothetical protein
MEDLTMRLFLLAFAVACCTTIASAENVIVTTTTVISAQETADDCARTGLLRHCRVLRGNQKEGIGFSTVSPEAAEKSACFYSEAVRGRYRIVERGVSYSPTRRGWFAVLRYSGN